VLALVFVTTTAPESFMIQSVKLFILLSALLGLLGCGADSSATEDRSDTLRDFAASAETRENQGISSWQVRDSQAGASIDGYTEDGTVAARYVLSAEGERVLLEQSFPETHSASVQPGDEDPSAFVSLLRDLDADNLSQLPHAESDLNDKQLGTCGSGRRFSYCSLFRLYCADSDINNKLCTGYKRCGWCGSL
jgi:hypothetical protein